MRRTTQIRYISTGSNRPENTGPGGLLARILAFVIGIGVLGIAIFLGAIFIAGFLGLLIIVGLVVMVRVWWLKRKMTQYAQENGDLDADYTVVDEQKRD